MGVGCRRKMEDDGEDVSGDNIEARCKEKVENFYGVYLLLCLNPKYRGRTYIGFTVDPIRRLKQHNAGSAFGGARRTSNRGPWAMVVITHGFPNMISALRFEWAWQHPQRSRRLNHLPNKKKSEKSLAYQIRLLGSMLSLGPWNRFPLSVRWLRPDLKGDLDFDRLSPPPIHMAITYGPIEAVKKKPAGRKKKGQQPQDEDDLSEEVLLCGLCIEPVALEDKARCISPKCQSVSHLVCLAEHFRKTSSQNSPSMFLPVDGACPVCEFRCLWGDIIRKKKGCFEDLPFKARSDENSQDTDSE